MSPSSLFLISTVVVALVHFCIGTKETSGKTEDGTSCLGGVGQVPPPPLPLLPLESLPAPLIDPSSSATSSASSSSSAANSDQIPSVPFEYDDFSAYFAFLCQNDMDIEQFHYNVNNEQTTTTTHDANPSTNATHFATNDQQKMSPFDWSTAEHYGDQFLTDPNERGNVGKMSEKREEDNNKNKTKIKMNKKIGKNNEQRKSLRKTAVENNHRRALVAQIDQSVEKFVANSNKMWEKIRAQLAIVEMQELMEKQKTLETMGHEGLSKFSGIAAAFKTTKDALIMAGRVADIAVVGIGIALFLFQVEVQAELVVRLCLNTFLETNTRWMACKLVRLTESLYDAFARSIATFGERFNAKCRKKTEYATSCMESVKNLLDKKEECQMDQQSDEMSKKLLNLNIYLRYLRRIDDLCRPLYGNATVGNTLPTLRNLFHQIRLFIYSTAVQFDKFKQIAHLHGIEVMERKICG